MRYRSLYAKLEKKKRHHITVLDYCESIRPNYAAWKKVTLKGDISLSKAYEVAEKIDRLEKKANYKQEKFNPARENSTIWKEGNTKTKIMKNKNVVITKGENVIKCFFCMEEGHFQSQCPKLKEIVEQNKKEIFGARPLN